LVAKENRLEKRVASPEIIRQVDVYSPPDFSRKVAAAVKLMLLNPMNLGIQRCGLDE
jgi:hypothetical protein